LAVDLLEVIKLSGRAAGIVRIAAGKLEGMLGHRQVARRRRDTEILIALVVLRAVLARERSVSVKKIFENNGRIASVGGPHSLGSVSASAIHRAAVDIQREASFAIVSR